MKKGVLSNERITYHHECKLAEREKLFILRHIMSMARLVSRYFIFVISVTKKKLDYTSRFGVLLLLVVPYSITKKKRWMIRHSFIFQLGLSEKAFFSLAFCSFHPFVFWEPIFPNSQFNSKHYSGPAWIFENFHYTLARYFEMCSNCSQTEIFVKRLIYLLAFKCSLL